MSECFVSPKNKITEILSRSFKTKLENLEKLVCTANSLVTQPMLQCGPNPRS